MFDIIKSQPLEKLYIVVNKLEGNAKKCIYASEFRSKTLKELSLDSINFKDIDLSFISKLEYLEHLEFNQLLLWFYF